jgi:hypothetical protein
MTRLLSEPVYCGLLLRQRSCACWTAAMAAKASERRPLRMESRKLGRATAASTPRMITTIISSIIVKPRLA